MVSYIYEDVCKISLHSLSSHDVAVSGARPTHLPHLLLFIWSTLALHGMNEYEYSFIKHGMSERRPQAKWYKNKM